MADKEDLGEPTGITINVKNVYLCVSVKGKYKAVPVVN
jgi:hypothetical protein